MLAGSVSKRFPRASPRPGDIDELVRWIVTTPREPALRRGARELCDGLDASDLLGALFVASAREVRTDLPIFNHAALSVSAIDQLTETADAGVRQRNALWCLDYFKEVQEAEAQRDDWRMTPVEAVKVPSGTAARAALVDALERWDRDAADVAIAGFVRSAPLNEVYALIWEYGLRCVANLGHKGIYAVLSRRALPLAGERHAEDVLRSVVTSFFTGGRSAKSAPFERSRALVAQAIVPAVQRAADAGASRELLAALRQHEPDEMPAIVAKLIAEGTAPSVLWDAIVAAACEVSVADPGIATLHALTSVNSLHHIGLHAPSQRIAQLALLQAAAWVAQFRLGLPERAAAIRVDAIEGRESELDRVLCDEPSLERVRGAIWLGAHRCDAFVERARHLGRTLCDDVHEYKLTAATLEEARLSSGWVRPLLCATTVLQLPSQCRPESARLRRIADAAAVAKAR